MNKTNEKGITRITLILGAIGVVLVAILIWSMVRNNSKKEELGSNVNQNVKEEFVQNLSDGSKLNVSEQLQKSRWTRIYKYSIKRSRWNNYSFS